MPGSNCALPGCGSNQRSNFSSIGIFQVPNSNGKLYIQWKKDPST